MLRYLRIYGGGDGGDLQIPPLGPDVEGLDLLQNVLDAIALHGDNLLGEGIKHEGVVGVGAVTDTKDLHGDAPFRYYGGVGISGSGGRLGHGAFEPGNYIVHSGALGRDEARLTDEGLDLVNGGAIVEARLLHHVFVEEGAAEVVSTEVQGYLARLLTFGEPGGLYVLNVVQIEAG